MVISILAIVLQLPMIPQCTIEEAHHDISHFLWPLHGYDMLCLLDLEYLGSARRSEVHIITDKLFCTIIRREVVLITIYCGDWEGNLVAS